MDGFIDEFSLLEPRNDYGITHMFAEEYVKMYKTTSGISYIILRPTNIYGAPIGKNIDRWTLVPNCFCKEAFEDKKITLMSSGKQMRDFINLHDLINITKLFLNRFDYFQNKTVNISSGNNFTIIEIATLVKEQYEKIFNENCDLIIKSDIPAEKNQYSINRELIKQLGYNFSNKSSIIDEINSIFNLLTN